MDGPPNKSLLIRGYAQKISEILEGIPVENDILIY
jgi:hypothetical protein